MGDVFVLPAAVVDTALGLASPEQVRVLLWFSRHRQQWDAAACAAAVGGTAAQCESHLQFWLQQGVLQPVGEAAPAPAKVPLARPAAVKPQLKEVLAYQKAHPGFSAFLDAASGMLGKAIGPGDVATLLYLLDTVGLPESVILMEIAYCVSLGKTSIYYVEKLALNWADEDLTTHDAVDAHIRLLQRQKEAADRVERVLSLPRALNKSQSEMAHRWVNEWGFSDQMLQHAHTRMLEKSDKPNLKYMDKILEAWYADGIQKPEQIPQPAAKKSHAAATNPEQSSLDLEGFEQQVRQYRPKYNKKQPDKNE